MSDDEIYERSCPRNVIHSEDEQDNENDSNSLLSTPTHLANSINCGSNESGSDKGVKRVLESILSELRVVKKQNLDINRSVSKVMTKIDKLEKPIKEMSANSSKDSESLDELLTADGIRALLGICFNNLDQKAKTADETELLNSFLTTARNEGWLIKATSKAEKDLFQGYRGKRNYLKAQVRLRLLNDMINKSAENAVQLTSTLKFIRESLKVNELSESKLKIVYNLAYTHAKYLNKNIIVSNCTEKSNKERAKSDIWAFVMDRVDADKKVKRIHEDVKEKLLNVLEANKFEPVD